MAKITFLFLMRKGNSTKMLRVKLFYVLVYNK